MTKPELRAFKKLCERYASFDATVLERYAFATRAEIVANEAYRLHELAETNEQAADALWAERDRLRTAVNQARRGFDAIMWITKEGRGANGKLEDIRYAARAEIKALQEAGDE